MHPPYIHPSTHPPIPPQPTFNPSVCPVTTVERMSCLTKPKKTHPKNPSVKSILNSTYYKQVVKRLKEKPLYYYILELIKNV